MTADLQNRPYAKLSTLRGGQFVLVDNGFTCMSPGRKLVYRDGRKPLYVCCADGRHYLDSQLAEDGDTLVGIYPAEPSE